jgi:hypothetical protein
VRLLAFNWRDPKHPEAGGAELHLMEILSRAVQDGDQVTWLAEAFAGSAPEEEYRGIRILRGGSWYNAHLALAQLYRRKLWGERFDLVLEDINKVPFFTPWYVRAPVLAVVPHLFGTAVFREASIVVGALVWAHESLIPLVYRDVPFLVISESTRDDLVRRLRKYKGAQYLIRAFPEILRAVPAARLQIVGDGPYRPHLERLVRSLGIGEAVEFLGALSHRDKVAALNRAQVAAAPSPKEGWGLTVIEANACGTPVVASRSPGLVESVRDGDTGLLVRHGDVPALARATVRLLTDRTLRLSMAEAGLRWAHGFTWERCYRESRAVILRAAGGQAA